MDLAGNALNAIVIGAVGVMLWLAIRGRLVALERRMDRFDHRLEGLERRLERLEGRIDGLDERFQSRFDRLEQRVDGLRTDLTQVALAVGARPQAGSG